MSQDFKNRQSIRLRCFDYTSENAYFLTICTQFRQCVFGEIVDGKMVLNEMGKMIQDIWLKLPNRFPNIELGTSVIMPNHTHGIVILRRGEPCVRPSSAHPRPSSIYIAPNNIRMSKKFVDPNTIVLDATTGEHKVRPYGTKRNSLGHVVQVFKSISTNEYIEKIKSNQLPRFESRLWQRNYHEHIIRNAYDYDRISKYILNNPSTWQDDVNNPITRSISPSRHP